MPEYTLKRTWIGAMSAILAVVIAVLGLLSIAPATPTIFFLCILLLAIACLA